VSASKRDAADGLLDFGLVCGLVDGAKLANRVEIGPAKAKLAGISKSTMVVLPPDTLLQTEDIVAETVFIEKQLGTAEDFRSAIRASTKTVHEALAERVARARVDIDHTVFDPLWIGSQEQLPDELQIGMLVTNGGQRIVSVNFSGDGRSLFTREVRIAGEWQDAVYSWPAIVVLAYMNRYFNSLAPIAMNFRLRAAHKDVGRMLGKRPTFPSIYSLDIDKDRLRDLVHSLVSPEETETMPLPRIAIVGGDNRILRQNWPPTLDVRPYIGDDHHRVLDAAQTGKVDAIVILIRFIGHPGYEMLKRQSMNIPVYFWRRGLTELAKALDGTTTVADISTALRQADGGDKNGNGEGKPEELQAAPDRKLPDYATLTWGEGIRTTLSLDERPFLLPEILDTLDVDQNDPAWGGAITEIQGVLDAMVAREEVIRTDEPTGTTYALVREEIEAVIQEEIEAEEIKADEQIEEDVIPAPQVQHTEEKDMAKHPRTERAPDEPMMLISWANAIEGDIRCRMVDKEKASEVMSALMSGDNPTVDSKTVRLWRQAKIRVRVEIE